MFLGWETVMAKKTYSVDEMWNNINISLKNSTNNYSSAEQRLGIIKVLEMILHQTGNYRGFRYLMLDEVPDCHLPGIIVYGTIEDTPPEIRFQEGKVDKHEWSISDV